MKKYEEIVYLGTNHVVQKNLNVEIVSAIAERNILTSYKSLTRELAESAIKDAESLFDNKKYFKLVVVGDETTTKTEIVDAYLFTLSDTDFNEKAIRQMERRLFGENSSKRIVCNYINEIDNTDKSDNYYKVLGIANTIQDYLYSTFNFVGTTKVSGVVINDSINNVSITSSGKGVNDKVVDFLKKLGRLIIRLDYSEDELFRLMDMCSES